MPSLSRLASYVLDTPLMPACGCHFFIAAEHRLSATKGLVIFYEAVPGYPTAGSITQNQEILFTRPFAALVAYVRDLVTDVSLLARIGVVGFPCLLVPMIKSG